jgi:ribonucleoside-diphosphate reductase alpha chain
LNVLFFEMRSNIYVRRVRAGEFVIINKHLVRSLMAEGLWTKKVIMVLNFGDCPRRV